MNVHKRLSLWEPWVPGGAPHPVWKNQNADRASGSHQVATGKDMNPKCCDQTGPCLLEPENRPRTHTGTGPVARKQPL
ncbi:mCG64248 [Mus musculus]|nr:mCG64248 [Mus musculus]